MHYKKKKRRGSRTAVIITLVVLVLAATATAVFLALGGLPGIKNEIAMHSPPPEPYFSQGEVRALTLQAYAGEQTEQAYKEYFAQAVAFAKENGFNTLIYEGKTGIEVYWRDEVFPPPAELRKQDGIINQLDPLELLCEAAKGQSVQIWLSMNPYDATGLTEDATGPVAELARSQNTPQFNPADGAYTALLAQSINGLPQKYPLAGIVFANLNTPTPATAEDGSIVPPSAEQQEAFAAAFTQLMGQLQPVWAEKAYKTQLILGFDEHTSLVSTSLAASLVQSGQINYLQPAIYPGAGLSHRLAGWTAAAPIVLVQPPQDDTAVTLFTASRSSGYGGAVFGSYPAVINEATRLGILKSTLLQLDYPLPTGFDIPQTLRITFPLNGAKYSYENVYIMGTSDPTQPLLINGTEITNRAPGGAFGTLVELQTGTNTFTFTNGTTTLQHTIERPAPSSYTPNPKPDGTKPVEPGQAVEISTLIASALKDYTNMASMNETFHIGAVAVVQESVEFTSGNTISNAYKLTSGDWVLASNCKAIPGTGASSFSGLAPEDRDGGETLVFTGNGTPATYIAYDEASNSLSVTMYDTSFTLPAGFSSRLVQSASVENGENSVTLTLKLNTIWGYNIEYSGGKTQLFLKDPPTPSTDPARPLQGVHVLLDPGHGGTDAGALGIGGEESGPNEKHINLALAQATAYRLRQLGAEVTLSREDDETFPSLTDRLLAQSVQKPDFFISIHHNSAELNADRSGAMGSQSYYYHPYSVPNSKQFAQNLISSIAPTTGRNGTDSSWGYYYVTRTTVCPSVLFEYGFVISPLEFEDITSTDGLYAAACATAAAIIESMPAPAPTA